MEVRHGFTGIGPVIDNQSISGLRKSKFSGHLCRLEEQVSQNLVIPGFGISDPRDRLLRNDQHVSRRLGFDVAESDYFVIFVNDRRGDFARDDFFEQRLAHGFAKVAVDS